MTTYRTRSKPNPECPQPDSREIAPESLVYVPQRSAGGPSDLVFGKPDADWERFIDEAEKVTQ